MYFNVQQKINYENIKQVNNKNFTTRVQNFTNAIIIELKTSIQLVKIKCKLNYFIPMAS